MILGIEREEIATAVARLVFAPADRHTLEVTQQESANAAVGDDGDVTHRFGHSDDLIDCSHNPALRVDGALPAAYAFFGSSKELVGCCLEFGLGQEAVDERSLSPRAAITAEISPTCGARTSAASRAFRSALQNRVPTAETHGWRAANFIRRMPMGESRQSGTGVAGSMMTSGCVMK